MLYALRGGGQGHARRDHLSQPVGYEDSGEKGTTDREKGGYLFENPKTSRPQSSCCFCRFFRKLEEKTEKGDKEILFPPQ